MRSRAPSERLVWAVNAMDIRPSDRMLEIGCGHGVAVDLVCEMLDSGSILAIDRSATMIAVAERRNAHHVHAGRADFMAAPLERARLDDRRFDKVFAVNVGLFWRADPSRALTIIRERLDRRGALYLFAQAPPQMGRPSAGSLPSLLDASGFTAVDVIEQDLASSRVLCVVAVKE